MKKNGLHIDNKDTIRWYFDGKLHCEDGPAEETQYGAKFWYRNGLRHREDGPALEYADGSKRWYLNDELHRLDGPAAECSDGTIGWYLNGVYLGANARGFWALWDRLSPEKQNNLNLHQWLAKYT